MLREGDLRMVQEGKAALERRACEEPAKLDFRKLYDAYSGDVDQRVRRMSTAQSERCRPPMTLATLVR